MIIGIDGNEANVTHRVGIGHYAFNLLHGLHHLDTKNQYIIYLKHPPLSDLPALRPNWQYRLFGPTKLWTIFALPFHLYTDNQHLDLFFSPSHYSPRFSPFPTVCSIMDLGFLHYPSQFTHKDLYQLINWTDHSAKKASKIITISQFTKNEIVDNYHINPDNIFIAYPGTKPLSVSPSRTSRILSGYQLSNRKYFLYLGALRPNKNIPALLHSFFDFHQRHQEYKLVIAGPKGWFYDDIFHTVEQLNLSPDVILTGYISETIKWVLLRNAQSLVIPSLYEGFGIPAIESMSVGTPVIASNIASLPEIINQSGILITPTNSSQLTQALLTMTNPTIRTKYAKLGLKQSKNFTWNNAAKSILEAFNSL